jgi:nicotinate-nucleotide adenylyltransferase
MSKDIVILGGTFNPPHNGHIYIGNQINKIIKPEKTLIIPAYSPPHKELTQHITANQRLSMCNLAADGLDRVEVSDIEIQRKGKSYTVDTLESLNETYKNYKLNLVLGTDMLMSFNRWKEPERILSFASLLILPRDDTDKKVLLNHIDMLKSKYACARVRFLDIKPLPISSTLIRSLVLNNCDISEYVPIKVLSFIKENSLYKDVHNKN